MSQSSTRLIELLVMVIAVLAPLFLLANRIDSDEWEKAAIVGAVAGVMAVYREWRSRGSQDGEPSK